MYQNITTTKANRIATITINRPQKLNALNKNTIEELHESLKTLAADPKVRVIILTGSGEKAFVAGADIAEFAHFDVAQGSELAAKGQEILFDFVENMSKPVIAAINGFALGGGLELAMACHFRVASENAKMGLPEVSLGVIPGYGGTQRLPQLVGKGRAMEMIMTAQMVSAARAYEMGLVNHVVPQADLLSICRQLGQKILQNSPQAISTAIKAVNTGMKDRKKGFAEEIKGFGQCFGTEEFKEGTTAFLEKRKAHF